MRRPVLGITLLFVVLAPSAWTADLYEPFAVGTDPSAGEYTNGMTIVGTSPTVTGFTNVTSWTDASSGAADAYLPASTGLTYSGLATSGGMLTWDTDAKASSVERRVRRDTNISTPTAANTIYMSALIRVDDTWPNKVVVHFHRSAFPDSVWIEFVLTSSGFQVIKEGQTDRDVLAATDLQGNPPTLGTTNLFVARVTDGASDTLEAWFNPTLGAGAPSSSGSAVNGMIGGTEYVSGVTVYADVTNAAFAVDEIRVGNTFADVTPPPTTSTLVGFNAEDGSANATATLGSKFDPPLSDAAAVSGQYITSENTGYGASPGASDRVCSYELTFPEAGTYDLYARLYMEGASEGDAQNDDSMFYGNGFGTKSFNTDGDWITVNNIALEFPFQQYVWVNLSETTGDQGETPITFTVPDTNLTQTIQIGAREDGLRIDVLAFGSFANTFTDTELEESVAYLSQALEISNTSPSSLSSTNATLPGTLMSDGGDPTAVSVFWGETDEHPAVTGWDGSHHFGTNAASLPATYSHGITGLASNTLYTYRYYATNSTGDSAWADAVTFRTWGGAAGVTNMGAVPAVTTAEVSGELTNGGSASLWIAYGEDAGASTLTNAVGTQTQGVSFSTTLADLTPETLYYCKWIASNANGTAESHIESFTTGSRHFVTPEGAGVFDGSDWDNAFSNIQDAVDAAGTDIGEIYVKSGTYSNTSTITIGSANELTIYGGYVGSGDPGVTSTVPSVITRNSATNIGLVYATNSVLTLDNLTFSEGYVVTSTDSDYGAGLRFDDCPDVVLNACTLSSNVISCSNNRRTHGGAIGSHDSDLVLNACVLKNNQSKGAWAYGKGHGGAIYVNGGSCQIANSELVGNSSRDGSLATSYGGAVYIDAGTLDMVNCLIMGNDASAKTAYGDGVSVSGGSATMTLCTVLSNGGKGVEQAGSGALSISNSILWGNVDDVVGTVSLSYCSVEDGDSVGVNGCISAAPVYERGLYLVSGNPCIDAGDGTAAANGADDLTTSADGTLDGGAAVDLGYHFAAGTNSAVGDLYVALTGNDSSGDGSSGTPWRTITKALSVAENGTHVHIAAGVYSNGVESMPLSMNHHGVQLIGAGADVTELSGEESTSVLQVNCSGGDTRIEGLAICNGLKVVGSGGSAYGVGLNVYASTLVVDSCNVTDNICYPTVQGRSMIGAGIYSVLSSLTVTNSLIQDNTSHANGQQYSTCRGGGIYAQNVCRIFDSTIALNQTYPARYGNDGGAGLYLTDGEFLAHNVLIQGNTSVDGGDGVQITSSGTATFLNTTVANNADEGIYNQGTAAVTNSILSGNGDDVVGTVSLGYSYIEDGDNSGTNGCISSGPLFESGYYLADGSLCIDGGTGTPTSGGLNALTTRADGTLDTNTVDMGYHFSEGVDTNLANLYVAGSGDDPTGDGSEGNPYRSITKALSIAGIGSRIHVAVGTYDTSVETFPLTFADPGMQLLGTNAALTVIDAESTSDVLLFNGVSGGRLEGVSVINGYKTTTSSGPSIKGAGIASHYSSLTIAGCIVTNNKVVGNYGTYQYGAGIYGQGSQVVITNCVISHNSTKSSSQYSHSRGGGVYAADNELTIRDCHISSNQTTHGTSGTDAGAGIYLASGGPHSIVQTVLADNMSYDEGDGVWVKGSAEAALLNVTIAGNGGEGLGIDSGTVTVDNSILWDNGIDVTGTVTVAWSDVENADPAASLSDCISADPLFVDAAGGDYHLQSLLGSWHDGAWLQDAEQSPAIDAGDPADDVANEPEPNGGYINMGAYGGTEQASMAAAGGTIFRFR